MKDVYKWVGRFMFYAFVIIIFVWTSSLTLSFAQKVITNIVMAAATLVVYDFGALTWFFVFVGVAEGLKQRAIALIMMIMDLLGVVGMVAGEVLLGGQQYVEVSEQVGEMLVYMIFIWTALNLFSGYAFHIFDPKIAAVIDDQVEVDKVKERAQDLYRELMEGAAQNLALQLAQRRYTAAVHQMQLTAGDYDPGLPLMVPSEMSDARAFAQDTDNLTNNGFLRPDPIDIPYRSPSPTPFERPSSEKEENTSVNPTG